MLRPLLLSLPAVAAAIVAWALLGGGDERVRYVQVLGGPTREGSPLSWLVRAVTLDGERRLPVPGLALRAVSRAATQSASGTTDARGELEMKLELGDARATDPWLRVESVDSGAVLAEGTLSLDRERWQAGARREGGWLRAQTEGTLELRAAVESGVLAVPFEGTLVLQVLAAAEPGGAGAERGASPLAGAELSLELDGAERATTSPLVSDASGQARVVLRPNEHAVSARVVASAGARRGSWYGALPVTPGAIAVARTAGALLVLSPIVRERAYVSLVTQRERLSGAIVPLVADPTGGARGLVPLDARLSVRLDDEASWAVVSSEYDKRSAGAVGWPLSPPFDPASPRLTFTVADQVLLDGRDGALYDLERRRSGRRRIAGGALLAIGALMAASFWLEVRRGRRIGALERGGDNAQQSLVTRPGWLLAVALGCIILGLGALAYFGLLAR